MYIEYKIARDKAWEVLIKCDISTLPISLNTVIQHYNITAVRYSKSKLKNLDGDGFSTKYEGKYLIYYNDIDCSAERQRFTVAHEIGHILLGHVKEGYRTQRYNAENDKHNDIQETQANVFARDLLMPATVLHSLGVNSAEEIARLCNVSRTSSEIRFTRLQELNSRDMYNIHPLERKVLNNFKQYIKKHN